ncbi:MAG: hypothetical protein RTV31_15955 [Candidatus Thorarchaeota archaeon]
MELKQIGLGVVLGYLFYEGCRLSLMLNELMFLGFVATFSIIFGPFVIILLLSKSLEDPYSYEESRVEKIWLMMSLSEDRPRLRDEYRGALIYLMLILLYVYLGELISYPFRLMIYGLGGPWLGYEQFGEWGTYDWYYMPYLQGAHLVIGITLCVYMIGKNYAGEVDSTDVIAALVYTAGVYLATTFGLLIASLRFFGLIIIMFPGLIIAYGSGYQIAKRSSKKWSAFNAILLIFALISHFRTVVGFFSGDSLEASSTYYEVLSFFGQTSNIIIIGIIAIALTIWSVQNTLFSMDSITKNASYVIILTLFTLAAAFSWVEIFLDLSKLLSESLAMEHPISYVLGIPVVYFDQYFNIGHSIVFLAGMLIGIIAGSRED